MKHDPIHDAAEGTRPDPRAPGVIQLRQTARATFRAMVGETSMILRVERGRKVIRGAWDAEVPEGALTVIPAGISIDVENHPDGDGWYRATGLLLGAAITPPTGIATAKHSTDSRAMAAFERAVDLLRRPAVPQAIRDHAVQEVLLWLDAVGVRLPSPGPERLSERVRKLISSDLARDWTAAEVARALATSEPTLRRHLSADGMGFAALVTELRMHRALGLLQCTDLPVGVVAHEVGYASPSRFARRFSARFGIVPSAVHAR